MMNLKFNTYKSTAYLAQEVPAQVVILLAR